MRRRIGLDLVVVFAEFGDCIGEEAATSEASASSGDVVGASVATGSGDSGPGRNVQKSTAATVAAATHQACP